MTDGRGNGGRSPRGGRSGSGNEAWSGERVAGENGVKDRMLEEVKKAVEVLRSGGVILYPTDTVWGIGCDATDPDAVAKVFQIKRREDSKSLVLLASDLDMVARYVREIPQIALQLVEVNDRPMTIVYPGALVGRRIATASQSIENQGDESRTASSGSAESVQSVTPGRRPVRGGFDLAYNAVAEDGSVGIRIPLGGFCLELVRRFGRPLVSTSANISGGETPRRFSEISEQIRNAVDYIVKPAFETGATGRASSIIKVGIDSSIQIIRK